MPLYHWFSAYLGHCRSMRQNKVCFDVHIYVHIFTKNLIGFGAACRSLCDKLLKKVLLCGDLKMHERTSINQIMSDLNVFFYNEMG